VRLSGGLLSNACSSNVNTNNDFTNGGDIRGVVKVLLVPHEIGMAPSTRRFRCNEEKLG
jgi:hypothetical protein